MVDEHIEYAARRDSRSSESPFPEHWHKRGGLEEARAAGDVADWIKRNIDQDRKSGLDEYRALGSPGPCRSCGVVYRSPELNEIGECRACIYRAQVGKLASSPPPSRQASRKSGAELLREHLATPRNPL